MIKHELNNYQTRLVKLLEKKPSDRYPRELISGPYFDIDIKAMLEEDPRV